MGRFPRPLWPLSGEYEPPPLTFVHAGRQSLDWSHLFCQQCGAECCCTCLGHAVKSLHVVHAGCGERDPVCVGVNLNRARIQEGAAAAQDSHNSKRTHQQHHKRRQMMPVSVGPEHLPSCGVHGRNLSKAVF